MEAQDAAGDPDRETAEQASFAAELRVVDQLRRLASTADPDPAARERMRRRLLESLPAGERPAGMRRPRPRSSRPSRPAGRPAGRTAPHRSSVRGRFLVAGAAAFCMLLVLSALSMLLARDALPGDSLYRFKQLTERASLGLTFDREDQAFQRLEYAATRVNELEMLADTGTTAPAGYRLALNSLDADATQGARTLIELGTAADGATLTALRRWVNVEITQLAGLRRDLPPQVSERAESTAGLLDRIGDRVQQLQARLHCETITSGGADRIGLLPATDRCAPPSGTAGPAQARRPTAGSDTPGRDAGPGAQPPARAEPPDQKATPPLPGSGYPSRPLTPAERETHRPAGAVPLPPSIAPPTRPLHIPLPVPVKPLPPLLPGLPGISFG